MIAEIVRRHGLKAKCDATDVFLEHLSQTDESDLHLLKRLAKEYHCLFSIKNQTLLFLKKSETKQKKAHLPQGRTPHFEIPYEQLTSPAITHFNKTHYPSCQLSCHDSKTNASFKVAHSLYQKAMHLSGRSLSKSMKDKTEEF